MQYQKNSNSKRYIIGQVAAVMGIGVVAAALAVAGCATTSGTSSNVSSAKSETTASSGKTGAQLWAENCARCHNLRSPSEFSAAEWPIIVHEMAIRAPLTGDQERKITKFLQSAAQ